jgi:hypothetical protein
MLGMFGGQMMRTLPFMLAGDGSRWEWLTPYSELSWWPLAPWFGVVTWAVLLMFTISEAIRSRSCFFLVTGGLFSFLIAAGCGVAAPDVLTTVDAALHPFMEELTDDWAAGGWMFAGGVLGAAYGTLRRLPDVFSPRLMQIILGWLVAVAVMYAVLVFSMLGARPPIPI